MNAITRRTFLAAGVVAVAAACGDDNSDASPTTTTTTTPGDDPATATAATGDAGDSDGAVDDPTVDDGPLTPADFAGLGACVLMPRAAAGPFPLDEQFIRRDVTEGYPGHPLRLGLRAIDGDCEPIPGAAVEIWHADATGDYSAFEDGGNGKDEGPGTTFLRGTQIADDDGIVEFHTVYPGWYPGRAVHIHLRVRVDDELVLTGQIYFDDDYTAGVFAGEAYADNGLPDTTNATDGLAGEVATDGSLITLTAAGDGTLGLINVAVAA